MSAAGRRRLLRVLVAGIALNALVYGAYTLPRSLQERRLASQRVQLSQAVERERRLVEQLNVQTAIVRANALDVRRFYDSTVAPRSVGLVPLLRQIEGMAREGGLRPGAASYARHGLRGAPLDQFVVTMPVTGTYRQLVGFIERLERSPYFCTLDQVTVRGEDRGGARGQLDMVLSCYFRSAPGETQ